METNIFAAGTAPGSPNSETEIKTLVCYVLQQINKPMTFQQLHETFLENHLVNYFQLHAALNGLEDSGHIEKTVTHNIVSYHIIELGHKTAETLATSLPLTVKTKSVESAEKTLARSQRLSEVSIVSTPISSGGYNITLSLPEEGYHLASFTLFAPTKGAADKIKTNFLNHPTYIYSCVLALLTGEQGLADQKDSDETLF